jgi:hypothetical protein
MSGNTTPRPIHPREKDTMKGQFFLGQSKSARLRRKRNAHREILLLGGVAWRDVPHQKRERTYRTGFSPAFHSHVIASKPAPHKINNLFL